jgi:ribonuclease D
LTFEIQPNTPLALPAKPPHLVDTPAARVEMLRDLEQAAAIAIDTESDSLYRYFHKVCLIQISTRAEDYLVDPLLLPDLADLGPLMANPAIEKVFHAAENDILLLKRDFGFSFTNVFDTMLAARVLGWKRVGLAALLGEHFGIALDKRTQLTDWGHRPLTTSQLRYAALDSHYLLPLRDLLAAALQRRSRWREAQEAFADLPNVTYVEKPFDPDGFWHNKHARDLHPAELAVLRELYLWRDAEARSQNAPPFKVMNEETMVRLSQGQPARFSDLPPSLRRNERAATAVLAAIARGQASPPPKPPRRPSNGDQRPDPVTLALYDRLRAWRAARAVERDVDTDMVLTNQALMAIARAAPAEFDQLAALGVLGAWKRDEYGADLLRVIAGL